MSLHHEFGSWSGVAIRQVGPNGVRCETVPAGRLWQLERQDPGGPEVQRFHRRLFVLPGKYPVILPQFSCLYC